MKARVHVFYKDSVFDPQGNTLADSLRRVGFSHVNTVRVGRVIDVVLDAKVTKEQAARDIKKMCDELLVNPVIESFQYEFLDTP